MVSQAVCLFLLGSLFSCCSWARHEYVPLNVTKLTMFVDELPHIPKIRGFKAGNGTVARSRTLIIGMFKTRWKFHRDLPATPVFAFGTTKRTATVPGPTIEALQGINTYVTWENHLPSKHILPWDPTIPVIIPKKGGVPTVVHLHGSIDEPASDGNLNAWFTAGFKETGSAWTKKTYHYVNAQHPGTLYYHDHAMGLTRVNILAGLFGAYVLRQPHVENPLALPHGDEFDRPLFLFDRNFLKNGSIFMNSTGDNPTLHPQWRSEYFGDVIVVNGKAWPFLKVRRRKYRFRIINASNARFFRLFFSGGNSSGLQFIHVGSDSAYLEQPVITDSLLLAPSEISDVVIDFSKSKSDVAVLVNDAPCPYPSGVPVNELNGKIMKFIIRKKTENDKSRVPNKLMEYRALDIASSTTTRYITLYMYMSETYEPTHLYINGIPYEAAASETPKVGGTEVWNVINLSKENHPLHIHLGLFRVLEQREIVNLDEFTGCMMKMNDAMKCNLSRHEIGGRKTEAAANEQGWKNVYKMMPGYVTKILITFSYIHTNASYPFDATAEPGYAYHCHMLDHEDNAMMRPLKLIN